MLFVNINHLSTGRKEEKLFINDGNMLELYFHME